MPTPPLPLFRSLLETLKIPINPPTLSSIPPSLILLTLEKLTNVAIPLPKELKRPKTRQDELALIKVLLGVMGDDILHLDLSMIDPSKIVAGCQKEMEAIIMVLLVIAKRNHISINTSTLSKQEPYGDLMDDGEYGGGSFEPIQPDVTPSFDNSISTHSLKSPDVFTSARSRLTGTGSFGLFNQDQRVEKSSRWEGYEGGDGYLDNQGSASKGPTSSQRGYTYTSSLRRKSFDPVQEDEDGMGAGQVRAENGQRNQRDHRDHRDLMAFEKVTNWRDRDMMSSSSDARSSSNGTGDMKREGKTVLQEMMDEFGLG